MRIGGTAMYFAELKTEEDVEEAVAFARAHNVPIIPLGSGSNTIFADGEIRALVVQVKHDCVTMNGDRITVGAGKNLPMLVNELAKLGLDLSPLTGIPGTVGGAIFGNAGQGPKGIWIDSFVESVTVFIDGEWRVLSREECGFGYRESGFKNSKLQKTNSKNNPDQVPARIMSGSDGSGRFAPSRDAVIAVDQHPIIWETSMMIPKHDPVAINATIESLLRKRIETQPHVKTAGSCFKAVGGVPAWQLIDAAGLRGHRVGGIEISPKHANFLINVGEATYADAVQLIDDVQQKIPDQLEVEMRFVEGDGKVRD